MQLTETRKLCRSLVTSVFDLPSPTRWKLEDVRSLRWLNFLRTDWIMSCLPSARFVNGRVTESVAGSPNGPNRARPKLSRQGPRMARAHKWMPRNSTIITSKMIKVS